MTATTCTWTYSADEDSWDAECGHKFSLNDGTPAENGIRFCHSCGKPLTATDQALAIQPKA